MFRRLLAFCALGTMMTAVSGAQEEPASPGSELRELRKLVEQQSRQIDALTQEVARVARLLEKRPADSTSPSSPEPAPPPATTDTQEAPRASLAAPAGISHVVAKGETLTSIAKLYKLTVADLQKINKIENERTLQIGQTLAIPPPKPPEQPRNP